jgi:hypothetical protein
MKKYIEWQDVNGKTIRLRFEGERESAERTTFNVSKVWKSEKTRLIIVENGEEKTAIEIIRK